MGNHRKDIHVNQTRFLDSLIEMLRDRGSNVIFPCIRDLVVNGLDLSRLSSVDPAPNRQDATQYLAAWCRYVRLDEEVCREWLCEYSVAMLSSISKTSASGIRHSTKSNVRYIYRSEIAFVCGRESNRFKARCSNACPVYAEMATTPGKAQGEALTAPNDARPPARIKTPPAVPVKQLYRQQFEAALRLVRRELEKGAKRSCILSLLNQGEMKTRTGRNWTYAILCSEISEIRKLTGTSSEK